MIAADLAGLQVWVATTPVDMRKSFDGLAEVVRSFLGHDPLGQPVRVSQQRRTPRKSSVVGLRRTDDLLQAAGTW